PRSGGRRPDLRSGGGALWGRRRRAGRRLPAVRRPPASLYPRTPRLDAAHGRRLAVPPDPGIVDSGHLRAHLVPVRRSVPVRHGGVPGRAPRSAADRRPRGPLRQPAGGDGVTMTSPTTTDTGA